MQGLDRISPVAQDYLQAIWKATEWGADPITTTGLAKKFGTTSANVSEAMRRLDKLGLVTYEPYHPVTLTDEGLAYALAMVRRHRLIETFLVRVLNYSWDEIHDEADRLEHAVSEEFVERIDAFLGHPEMDPHGDLIDPKDTTTSGAAVLSDVPQGTYRIVRIADDDPDTLARCAAAGLVPGKIIAVDLNSPTELLIRRGTQTWDVAADREAIFVVVAK